MRVSLIMKFAVRTLGRSKRRTLLSAIGIGVGCAVALFITAFMRSGSEMRIRAIADSGFGHLRIAPSGWMKSRENKLRLSDWRDELQAARSMDGVRVAAPHTRTTVLLAFGTRVTGVQMLGVDPLAEKKLSCLIRAVQEGRYLRPGDRDVTVIGSAIAERLEVELEDDLFLTVVREDGNMEYAMLRIVGIVNTGSRDIDASICHVMLDDLERLSGFGGAGEITITLKDPSKIDETAAQLIDRTGGRNEILTWREIQPAQGADSASDKAFMNLFIGIVGVVVF